jgi:hypothetical protein
LGSNRQLAAQMREAFRSGALDADHQRAIISLITRRARHALPEVTKRVRKEWTSTPVAANQERRSRQRSAELRMDIAGSGAMVNNGRRPLSPRDLDYSRLSELDILNLSASGIDPARHIGWHPADLIPAIGTEAAAGKDNLVFDR